jgi:CheY-like chemotaxis protein
MMLLFIAALSTLGFMASRNFRAFVQLRFQAADLAEDLQLQKEIAEKASLAKSSFLAAASHDLRQPVHAMTLFIGALRGVAMPQEGERLVAQIEASAAAMDMLFGALLDISRLDAGVVEVRPQVFALQPLLDRVRLDHQQEAAAKGVTLSCQPTRAVVETDPVLVERILRNLISNAVRYTPKGRVLIGCRRSPLRVEVWDTGPGIAAADQKQIFEEYFQLENPERDRTKGLGLGLAIVRRLSDLLGSELTLASHPGRGSCFSITLPRASARPAPPAPAGGAAEAVLRGRLIAVIDDESAIREAMSALLTGWDHEVVTAGSGEEMAHRLAARVRRPDLIVCDYRLRGGETGVNVIATLRARFGADIPALLITGDTAPDRLAEAQASGLLLLHKPVPNGRLRAAISNLLRQSRPQASLDLALS